MQRGVQLAGVAALALVLVAATMVAIDSRGLQTDVLVEQQAQMQQLPEFSVAGTMQTGAPAPQGIPLSFQLPVPLPAPSPPAPTVITVGPRPKKAPVCKRCERQMRKIKVSDAREGGLQPQQWRSGAWRKGRGEKEAGNGLRPQSDVRVPFAPDRDGGQRGILVISGDALAAWLKGVYALYVTTSIAFAAHVGSGVFHWQPVHGSDRAQNS